MFKAHHLATLLLLSAFPSVIAQDQSDPGRPRRTQTPATVTEVSDRKPTSPEAIAEAKKLYNSGVKYGRAGLFKQAAASFEQAVKLNPDYAEAYLGLGHAYYDLHLWEQAIETLNNGLALKPKDKTGIGLRADARLMLEREKGSREKIALEANDVADSSPSLRNAAPLPVASKPANDPALTKVYRVGPGDILDVRLTDAASSQSTLFTVTPAGFARASGSECSVAQRRTYD